MSSLLVPVLRFKPARYFAIISFTTGALLFAAATPGQQIQPVFFLSLGAALVSGWYAGWRSRVLLGLLSLLGLFYIVLPPLQQTAFESTHELVRFTIFSATTLVACWCLTRLHCARVAVRQATPRSQDIVRTLPIRVAQPSNDVLDRRTKRRFPIHQPVVIEVRDHTGYRKFAGTTENASQSGVIMLTDSRVPEGAEVTVTIQMPEPIRVSSVGKVVRVEPFVAGNKTRIAVQCDGAFAF